ncbi:hypothetical protein [Chitinophaga arvensicola]|uniref:Uncharacterized protein n=1 Tax=Chitinophaga arvensicola TaxID=29529 RepID=A0A1I0S6V4_9BACT|nr:hypothetical protein [Chitinophaga arvensicola]SEW51384.1 hypothetical protein SAMN04488122_4221 [Chitinophaga arvensicola]
MAEDINTKNVIKKNDPAFPTELDFETLRSEGIGYLGQLSGKIWTDHNAHDPGITILEVLCYSLLDMGYRTSLPFEDLLSMNPGGAQKEDNFFTPARILTVNPLTITDYRKLLMDIDGVRNAWLEIAGDVPPEIHWSAAGENSLMCRGKDFQEGYQDDITLVELNGLYNIFIEPETLPEDSQERAQALSDLKEKIRRALMAHRNLCEDFYNITILCHEEIGVCTEIQLEEGADLTTVLNELVLRLYNFFSPRVTFYTLQQMLQEKQVAMEDIFAGRAYAAGSHGFIDTTELNAITRPTEIHVSDVYHVMFDVAGIATVSGLSIAGYVSGSTSPSASTLGKAWILPLLTGHLPVLSLALSRFVFKRGSATFTFDGNNLQQYLNGALLNGTKVWYEATSAYLDQPVPAGFYREDLGNYYSLQRDFPRVYGIGDGELGNDASPLRKVQAWQLKGFLLFFDQLLADYLGQLQHLRDLFSMSPDATPQTYFSGGITDVPDLDKLLRFQQGGFYADLGWKQNDTLMLPVAREILNELHTGVTVKKDVIQRWRNKYYSFDYLTARNTAVEQLMLDMTNRDNNANITTYLFGDSCWCFVIATPGRDYVLLGCRYYPSQQKAKEAAQSAIFLAAYTENLRPFGFKNSANKDQYAFDVVFSLADYQGYLRKIVEDKALYQQRRETMLNHLLARFAETFTDYALVLYGINDRQAAADKGLRAKASFLSGYDVFSSNRGKAYDYRVNKWNTSNTSGYEQRVLALAGIDKRNRHYLCPFIVGPYETYFYAEIRDAEDQVLFRTANYVTAADASAALVQLAQQLQHPEKLIRTDDVVKSEYGVKVPLSAGYASLAIPAATPEERDQRLQQIQAYFAEPPLSGATEISRYDHFIEVTGADGKLLLHSHTAYPDQPGAVAATDALLAEVKEDDWQVSPPQELPSLHLLPVNATHTTFINLDAFQADNIQQKGGKLQVQISIEEDAFIMFTSATLVKSEQQATDEFHLLLQLAAAPTSYLVRQNPDGRYEIVLVERSDVKATHPGLFDEELQAENTVLHIQQIVQAQLYQVSYSKQPAAWKYKVQLQGMEGKPYAFNSDTEYTTDELAQTAMDHFTASLDGLELQTEKGARPALQHAALNTKLTATAAASGKLQQALSMAQLRSGHVPADISGYIHATSTTGTDGNQLDTYVYRVINKTGCMARYPKTFADKATATDKLSTLRSIDQQGIDYLEICMGGEDVVTCVKDPQTQAISYYYVIRGIEKTYKAPGYPTVETEYLRSYKSYRSAAEAISAFQQQYLQLVHIAGDPAAYGSSILLEGTPAADPKNIPLAIVPAATITQFGGNAALLAIVPHIMRSFPYHWLSNVQRLRVSLYDITRKERIWKLCECFTDMPSACEGLQLFLALARYAGNSGVRLSECSCRYQVVMNEVLLESVAHYNSIADAWGTEGKDAAGQGLYTGLELLLDATRWGNSAYYGEVKNDSCYSFKAVKKGYRLAVHPYSYNTESDRTQYLEQLQVIGQQLSGTCQVTLEVSPFYAGNYFQLQILAAGEVVLYSARQYPTDANAAGAKEDWLFEVLSLLWNRNNYAISKDGTRFELSGNGTLSGYYKPAGTGVLSDKDKDEWIKKWQQLALYYPIRREKTAYGYTYSFRLYNSSFTPQEELPDETTGCNCDAPPPVAKPGAIVWESAAQYYCLAAAVLEFKRFCAALANTDNYQPSLGESCGPFGIELVDGTYVLALNPQCYSSLPAMQAAIDRAAAAINDEGMHVVEHILLRPRNNDDCQCLLPAKPEPLCELPWNEEIVGYDTPPDHPSLVTTVIPFADPYSFVATIVLPGWPVRFRNDTTRAMMEHLLRKEAPAHVLLNILWVRPRSFCEFETLYRRWLQHLACKPVCGDDAHIQCCLICYLFGQIDTMDTVSDTAIDPGCNQVSPSCFEVKDKWESDFGSWINSKFHQRCQMEEIDCLSNEIPAVPGRILTDTRVVRDTVTATPEAAVAEKAAGVTVTDIPEAPVAATPDDAAYATHRTNSPEDILLRDRKGRQRMSKYKQQILPVDPDNIVDAEAYDRTEKFMEGGPVNMHKYSTLSEFLLKHMPSGKKMAASEQALLLRNITWLCLDQLLLRRPVAIGAPEKKQLQQTLRKMKDKGINLSALAKDWKPEELISDENEDLAAQCLRWMK